MNLTQCSPNATLTSATVNFNATSNAATFTNLLINQTGMYILSVSVRSLTPNSTYTNIQCQTLPGIIVKQPGDSILTADSTSTPPDIELKFSSTRAFSDYSSEELNEFTAIIYNCLLNRNNILMQRFIELSDGSTSAARFIKLSAGSIVASMSTSGSTNAYNSLISTINNGSFSLANGVPLTIASVQGQAFDFGVDGATTISPIPPVPPAPSSGPHGAVSLNYAFFIILLIDFALFF